MSDLLFDWSQDIDSIRTRMREERAGLHTNEVPSVSDETNTTDHPGQLCAPVPPVGVPEGETEDTP